MSANFDDWMLGLSARFSPRSVMAPRDVLGMWRDELDEIVDWGAMLTTVLHPQVSGRPGRLRLLREFLAGAVARGDLWIATGAEIAGHFATNEVISTVEMTDRSEARLGSAQTRQGPSPWTL